MNPDPNPHEDFWLDRESIKQMPILHFFSQLCSTRLLIGQSSIHVLQYSKFYICFLFIIANFPSGVLCVPVYVCTSNPIYSVNFIDFSCCSPDNMLSCAVSNCIVYHVLFTAVIIYLISTCDGPVEEVSSLPTAIIGAWSLNKNIVYLYKIPLECVQNPQNRTEKFVVHWIWNQHMKTYWKA